MEISKIYPQNNFDRRQQINAVTVDMRSGIDRRIAQRYSLDPKLKNDINQTKDVFASFRTQKKNEDNLEKEAASCALSSIPFVRRFNGIEGAVKSHDYFKAIGLGTIFYANIKEDWKDIKKIVKGSPIPKDYQVPFSFTRGTWFERFNIVKEIRQRGLDISLYETKVGQSISKFFGVKDQIPHFTGEFDKFGIPIVALKADGSLFARIIGRGMMRIPVIGLAIMGLLELPAIIKSDNKIKQIEKSVLNVIPVVIGGALFGAAGAFLGALGSLSGLGMGSYLSGKFSKSINDKYIN